MKSTKLPEFDTVIGRWVEIKDREQVLTQMVISAHDKVNCYFTMCPNPTMEIIEVNFSNPLPSAETLMRMKELIKEYEI